MGLPNFGELLKLAEKARFAREFAVRGWGLAYQASSIDRSHQSHTLDLALKASKARRIAAIQFLIKVCAPHTLHS